MLIVSPSDQVCFPGIRQMLLPAALRRYHKGADKDPVVRIGQLAIDLVPRAVTCDGQRVSLARQEYRLLHLPDLLRPEPQPGLFPFAIDLKRP